MSWYSNVPSNNTLDMWIQHRFNVLFHGRHGVGKTSMVFDAFERAGWVLGEDYLYFSAATIDPWVDLIGVPSKYINEQKEEVLRLIRPENINNNKIKAFFVDELNRSHKKVRNAMMELIQFKSINGKKFPNLEIIWAAVNPDEDDVLKFDVEKLDPAQEDRFHIQVQIPYEPSESYFAKKFNNAEMAEAVCKWWKSLGDNIKPIVTPRRLEYAISVYYATGDLRYVLPMEANASVLKNAIEIGNPEKTLKKLIENGDEKEIRRWLAIENNLNATKDMICSNRQVCSKVLHLLSEERLVSFAAKHKSVIDQIKSEPKKYESIIRNLSKDSTNKILKETCQKLIPYLDSANIICGKINVPTKSIDSLNISKRRKLQISSNYRIREINDVPTVSNPPSQIVEQIFSIATECAFASNSVQRNDILQKLGDIVYSDMSKEESNACIKIIESISCYLSTEEYIYKFLPTINTCIISWNKSNKESVKNLFEQAPYLVNNILIPCADNEKTKECVIEKYDNKDFSEISDEPENKNNNIENLF